jgi:hypothetical protein
MRPSPVTLRHRVQLALSAAVFLIGVGIVLLVFFLAGLSRSGSPGTPGSPAAVAPGAAADSVVLRAPEGARAVGLPTEVVIPAIGVRERLHPVGLKPDGAMETPASGDAGWFNRGPRPGAPGPAVVLAHVHGRYGDDVFTRLHELRAGDRVSVRRTDGTSTFVVTGQELVAKEALPYDRIWNDTDEPVLRLITCGGTPNPTTGRYPANTIVYARLAR